MQKKDKRKFIVIAKVGNENFVKYRCNDIENCIKFIRSKFTDFRYANIFSKTGVNKGKMLFTYGKHKGLQSSY